MSDNISLPSRNTIYYLQQLQVLRALVWLAQAITLLLAHRWLGNVQLYTLLGFADGAVAGHHDQPRAFAESLRCSKRAG
jgi:hypothetical protein